MSKLPDFSSYFSQSRLPLYLAGGVASLYLISTIRSSRKQSQINPLDHVVPSPLKTSLPYLADDDVQRLPYPPDLFPGVRNVHTPYGSIRVYEWGPENGRKVLLVHGISTPCLSLGVVANKLAESGCRVMLFDLFGRGYSDDPSDLPHDARLYTTQILLVLASSTISWTGTNGFSLIGYSLGGGIVASFTASFPTLVESLVLIAPSGILRESHIAWQSKILYATEGILPEGLIRFLVKRRLSSGTLSSPPPKDEKAAPTDAVAAETGNADAAKNATSLFPNRPLVTVISAVQWQLNHHIGFIPAFISSIRHAPITKEQPTWRKIGERLSAQKANSANQQAMNNGLWRSKVLMILGKDDGVIVKSEIEVDAAECLGRGNLETVVLDGGHDIPTTKTKDVVRVILRFWGEESDTIEALPEAEFETGT